MYLFHKDIPVAYFEVNGNSIKTIKLNMNNAHHLPVSVKSEYDLANWLQRRGIPQTRDGIKADLGGITPFEYLVQNYGLSLTDCYWFKPDKSNLTWSTINPYKIDFSDTLELKLKKSDVNHPIPSASLQGDLRKKWVFINGSRCLIKGGSFQSIAEVFSNKIHEVQKFNNYVRYVLINAKINGKSLLSCACENFTTDKYEFVSAYDFINSLGKKPNDMSYYTFFLNGCESMGVFVKNFMEYMFLTDFIITNTDRHFNNFGLIRDVDTLKYVGIAPIFDSGNSLFNKSPYIPIDKGLLDIDINSFYSKEVRQLGVVTNPFLVNINFLPSADTLYYHLVLDEKLSKERIDRIIKAYLKKIEFLKEFQQTGKLVNKYKKR